MTSPDSPTDVDMLEKREESDEVEEGGGASEERCEMRCVPDEEDVDEDEAERESGFC